MSRRQFVTWTGKGLTVGALALPLVVEACAAPSPPVASGLSAGTGAPPTSTSVAARASTSGSPLLPTYMPFAQGPRADLPGNAQGLDPAYFKFPAELVTTVSTPPGDGSTVTAVMVEPLAAPPAVDQNIAWQAINKALNVNLAMIMVPNSEYQVRLATVLAGSDLPDFIYDYTNSNPYGVIPSLPAFAASRCTDLTPYLAGDAVKEYPNLAHYSMLTWRSGVVGGKLYAIPISRAPLATVLAYRADVFASAGVQINNAPKDADEFKRMLIAVNRPKQSQYAFHAEPQTLGLNSGSSLLGVFNVPNNWKLDPGGKLIKDFETDEYRAAVSFVTELWKAGVFHPDTLTLGQGRFNADFPGGRIAVGPALWGQFPDLWNLTATANPLGRVAAIYPFAHDGGKPSYLAGSSNFGWTLIKQQSSPERVKMLLRIANFFAAPFGTQEWLLSFYGVKDVDYRFDAAGSPQPTDQGRAELTATWKYITSPSYPLFNPTRSQDYANTLYPLEQAMLAALQLDPTQGLYSDTALTKGTAEQAAFHSGVVDIVVGRRPLSEFSDILNTWRQRAGDQIRAELQDGLQKAKG